MGHIGIILHKYKEALKYFRLSKEIFKKLKDQENVVDCYRNLAIINALKGNVQEALLELQRAAKTDLKEVKRFIKDFPVLKDLKNKPEFKNFLKQ